MGRSCSSVIDEEDFFLMELSSSAKSKGSDAVAATEKDEVQRDVAGLNTKELGVLKNLLNKLHGKEEPGPKKDVKGGDEKKKDGKKKEDGDKGEDKKDAKGGKGGKKKK